MISKTPEKQRVLVAYLRVCGGRQGRSGLGLEAQRAAIARFSAAEGFGVSRDFVEVESGAGAGRLMRGPLCGSHAPL